MLITSWKITFICHLSEHILLLVLGSEDVSTLCTALDPRLIVRFLQNDIT